MANTLDIIKDTKTATIASSSSKLGENQTTKDAPSLFDSLLTNNKNKEHTVDSTLTDTVPKTTENKEVKTLDTQTELNTENSTDAKPKNTNSLLDRMILEAKQDIKLSSEEEFKNSRNKLYSDKSNSETPITPETIKEVDTTESKAELETKILITPINDKKEVNIISGEVVKNEKTEAINNESKLIKIENPKIEENKDLIPIKIEKSESEIKNEDNTKADINKVTPSLNDKLEEIKDNTKNSNNKINTESLIIPETIKRVEKIEEIEDTKPKIINLDEEIKSSTLVKIESPEVEIKSKEDLKEKIDKTTSILDDNLIETKETIKISSDTAIQEKTIATIITETTVVPDNEKVNKEIDKTIVLNIANNDKLNVLNTSISSNPDVKLSLMDQLILKNSMSNQNIAISSEKDNPMQDEYIPKDIISNIYLSSQKNSINNQGLFNKNEAINLLKDANSLNDVKTSAQMLDLGLENVDVDVEQSLDLTLKTDLNKKVDNDLTLRKNLLNNLILEKNIKNEDVKVLITSSVEASKALMENSLKLADDAIVTVNSPLSYNIQSKIIGARQQMSTMMSDIAKQMYENYRPPVTVFRINLNPLELGSIAILMKSDKNNALSISMNVSNNGTLDALLENQNILRNSLNKTFDENTKFNLDFTSSNQDNNQSNKQNNQDNQNNSNKFEKQMDTQNVLQLKEENKDREEKSIDYM